MLLLLARTAPAIAQTPPNVVATSPGTGAVTPAPSAHLELKTSDRKGYIFIDGKVSGDEGAFAGDVPVGLHSIEVRREGFDSFTKSVSLADKQTYAETITLTRPASIAAGPATSGERLFEGTYGGFGVMGLFQTGSMGSELETHCSSLGATACDTPSPVGGGAFGFFGYTWNPVGFELMLGGMIDATKQRASFDGTAANGENLLLATPARNEQFTFVRYGGIGALRVRATIPGRIVRGSFAGGLGLSYKALAMQRMATSAGGSNLQDTYVPGTVSYISPGISLEASVQVRVSPTTSLCAGLTLWAENAGNSAATAADPNRHLASTATEVPLATPSYHVATSSQVFIGPYVGMMFGP